MKPPRPFSCRRIFSLRLLLVLLVALGGEAFCWTPCTSLPDALSGFSVDTTNRRDVLAYFNCVYSASEGYADRIQWTGGSVSGLQPGTTSTTFKNDVLRRVNFYRALVGLPADIILNTTKSGKDQDAALLFSRNNAISHFPATESPAWIGLSATGIEAAASSNIAYGYYGPGAVDGYIKDIGDNNVVVGHRRWLLYPRQAEIGTGDIPGDGNYRETNAIWVIGDFKTAGTSQFVAWPNSGYTPISLLPDRWSLSYPGADFSLASVAMLKDGVSVPLSVISRTDNGRGDNTIVWEPANLPTSVSADTTYTVTVSGIAGSGVPMSKTYSVVLFDPSSLGESVTISGSATPNLSGGNYTFNAIAQADSYALTVSQGSSIAWLEGAESSPVPQITTSTATGYLSSSPR